MSLFNFFLSSNNTFKGQRDAESTVLVVRKHWVTLFWPMAFLILFAILPFIINIFLKKFSWYPSMEQIIWFSEAIYFLILWNIFFSNIMIYSLNTIILTTERIIENEQKGFFNHSFNEMQLNKIQDISVDIKGIFASLLGYGDMLVQSAGTQNEFYFKTIPHPEEFKKLIMSQKSKCPISNP